MAGSYTVLGNSNNTRGRERGTIVLDVLFVSLSLTRFFISDQRKAEDEAGLQEICSQKVDV
jgi:hypothetical protein